MSGGTRTRRPSGATLVELVVALLLLDLILVGALATMHAAATSARRARVTESALWAATALADSVRAGLSDGSGRRASAWGWVERVDGRVEARDSAGRPLVRLEVGR